MQVLAIQFNLTSHPLGAPALSFSILILDPLALPAKDMINCAYLTASTAVFWESFKLS